MKESSPNEEPILVEEPAAQCMDADKIFNNCVNTFIDNNFIFTKHNKPSNNIPSNNIQNSSETRLIVNKYQ